MSARIIRGDAPAANVGGGGVAPPTKTVSPSARLRIPRVDAQMISYLRSVFPISVSPNYELRHYDIMVGQDAVIQHLEALLEDQK